MLAAAMETLLSPLYSPHRVKYQAVKPSVTVGLFVPPADLLFPVEVAGPLQTALGPTPDDLVSGVMYVLCYQPLHRHASTYLQLARAYVQAEAPDLPYRLMAEAMQAAEEGDWVGTVGRLWSVVQLDPEMPEALDDLAVSLLNFGYRSAARGDQALARKFVMAAGAALNTLHARFPQFGPGHLHRAEFLAGAGNEAGAFAALREALRLGLPAELEEEARDLVRDLSGLNRLGPFHKN